MKFFNKNTLCYSIEQSISFHIFTFKDIIKETWNTFEFKEKLEITK